jgi:hypothetical protein
MSGLKSMVDIIQPPLENLIETIAPTIFNHASITLTHQANQPIECTITCEVLLNIYQIIETQSFFNFKPELKNSPASTPSSKQQPPPTAAIAQVETVETVDQRASCQTQQKH